jgi:hypothetical protein
MTSRKPARAKIEQTLWHLFSRRTKDFAFFSASALGSPSLIGLGTHGTIVLRLNNVTRLRSILSKGGSSKSDVNEVVSVEKKGGHPNKNGVVGREKV